MRGWRGTSVSAWWRQETPFYMRALTCKRPDKLTGRGYAEEKRELCKTNRTIQYDSERRWVGNRQSEAAEEVSVVDFLEIFSHSSLPWINTIEKWDITRWVFIWAMVPWNTRTSRAVSKVLFPTSQYYGEAENSMVNVDRDQFTILCPIILSTGAPL